MTTVCCSKNCHGVKFDRQFKVEEHKSPTQKSKDGKTNTMAEGLQADSIKDAFQKTYCLIQAIMKRSDNNDYIGQCLINALFTMDLY